MSLRASAATEQVCCGHKRLAWAGRRRCVQGQRQAACCSKVHPGCITQPMLSRLGINFKGSAPLTEFTSAGKGLTCGYYVPRQAGGAASRASNRLHAVARYTRAAQQPQYQGFTSSQHPLLLPASINQLITYLPAKSGLIRCLNLLQGRKS